MCDSLQYSVFLGRVSVMESFRNEDGGVIVYGLIRVIQDNKAYLSEIDGAIGDGDHGINMNKGFSMCESRLNGEAVDLNTALKTLGRILLMEIGGSMGPIYGTFFREMAKNCAGVEEIDAEVFLRMLEAAAAGITGLAGAKEGDKTLYDCLSPATAAFRESVNAGDGFAVALEKMSAAAEAGRDSTIDMVAKLGRAARLGERSRGVLDAGSASCCLILQSMAATAKELLA